MQCHKYVLCSRVNSAGALLVREVLSVLHSAVHIMYPLLYCNGAFAVCIAVARGDARLLCSVISSRVKNVGMLVGHVLIQFLLSLCRAGAWLFISVFHMSCTAEYTVKKGKRFPVPSRDVTNQTR
jgi:hypothetical protein